MNQRNTKQKKLILDILLKDRTHPTIKKIYQMVQEIDFSIGQATVYRNVNKLVEEGKIRRISNLEEAIRYDGNMILHDHFICKKCGRIIDLFDNDYYRLQKKIESKYSVKVEQITNICEGLCNDCCNK